MKLYFQGHDYRYAAEQMLLTLFPDERPEYPPEEAGATAGSWARLTLLRGGTWATAAAQVCRGGACHRAVCRIKTAGIDSQNEVRRLLQHGVKLAFYRAGTRLLGGEPPWGALTGVRPVKLPVKAVERGAAPAQAEALLRRRYRVSPQRARLAMDCARACLSAKGELAPGDISLYAGIAFCPTRCTYCSFISASAETLKLTEPYLDVLLEEARAAGETVRREGRRIKTLYIGGGTPTTLEAGQISRLLEGLRQAFDLSACREFTVEAGRPDTITREKLEVLASAGVSRVSVNPQTMEDVVLKAIGRRHTAGEILTAYQLVRQAGIPVVNMDLIAGLPQDSPEGFRRSLDAVLKLGPENITVHTLALKKGARLLEEGSGLPEGPAVAQMLDYAWQTLARAGYRPYYLYRQKFMSGSFENVGWSLPGYESLYNICMMEELHTVLSLGAGGVTKLVEPETGRIVRRSNPKFPQEYIRDQARICLEKEQILTF